MMAWGGVGGQFPRNLNCSSAEKLYELLLTFDEMFPWIKGPVGEQGEQGDQGKMGDSVCNETMI